MAVSPIGGRCQPWLQSEWREDGVLWLMEAENPGDPIITNLKRRTVREEKLAKWQENLYTPEVIFTKTPTTARLTADPRPVLLRTHAGICMTSQPDR